MRPQKTTHTQKEKRKLILDKKSNLQPAVEGLHPPNPDIPSIFFDQKYTEMLHTNISYIEIFNVTIHCFTTTIPRKHRVFFFIVFHTIHTD